MFSLLQAICVVASSPGLSVAAFFVTYLVLVQLLRFSRLRRLEKKYNDRWATRKDGQRKLDVTPTEAQEIIGLSLKYDLPGITRFSMAWALFKTYAIPSISKILVKSGQLSSSDVVARRYTDTGVLISTWVTCPIVSLADTLLEEKSVRGGDVDPRGAIAIARVNWLHSRWPGIEQEDYLYTLSLFILEPIHWARNYGWRALTPLEEEVSKHVVGAHRLKSQLGFTQALFVFWSEVGRKLNVENIPDTFDELREWSQIYEETKMIYAESNYQTSMHTMDFLLHRVPKCLGTRVRNFFQDLVISLLDDRTREAFNLPKPSKAAQVTLQLIMGCFAFSHCYMSLPRIEPFEYTSLKVPDHVYAEAKRRGMLPRQHPYERVNL